MKANELDLDDLDRFFDSDDDDEPDDELDYFTCELCGKVFRYFNEVKDHMEEDHNSSVEGGGYA